MSRSNVMRKSLKTHDKKSFKYPFGEIGSLDYDLASIIEPLITQSNEDATILVGNFPNNITQWIWSRPGTLDEEDWLLLCKLDTGAFAFYRAGCDTTGFDCQGNMNLTVSLSLGDIIEHSMHNSDYSKYEAETIVFSESEADSD